MIRGVRFAALLLYRLMGQVHPFRNGGSVGVDGYWLLVVTVDAKVELGEVDEATWPNRQRDVIDKSLVVADLDKTLTN